MDRQKLLKCFDKPDDKLLFAKFIEQAYLCVKTGCNSFTDFTDPIKCSRMIEAFSKHAPEVNVNAFGGFEGAERLVLGFSANELLADEMFKIKALKIAFDKKFSLVEHRDILGAVLGLGLDRGQVGDVLVREGYAVVFAKDNMAKFIADNLFKVGRVSVEVSYVDDADALFGIEPVEEKRITVSSLRVDAVVAAAFNVARSGAAELIRKEKVMINWSAVSSAAKTIAEGDMLTARGIGRVKVLALEGTTKKERFVVKLLKY